MGCGLLMEAQLVLSRIPICDPADPNEFPSLGVFSAFMEGTYPVILPIRNHLARCDHFMYVHAVHNIQRKL